MKKWISLLCVCMLIMGTVTASVVSASAAEDVDRGETSVNVKKGDEVTYILNLENASEPVVGTDFSIYYDSAVFEVDSVADFNDNTNSEEWTAYINPNLDGEVKALWSILKGVDFSEKRHVITVKLKATNDANDTHITYRVRFLYGNKAFDTDNPKPYLETFRYTYDLSIDGETVDEHKEPEWNDERPTEHGKMAGGLPDGRSENADANLAGVIDKTKNKTSNAQQQNIGEDAAANNGAANGANANGSGANAAANANGSGSNNANGGGSGNSDSKTTSAAPPATTAEGYYILATDADGNVTATSDQAPDMVNAGGNDSKGGSSPVLWIIIVLVVLAGGGAAVYFYMKKKPADKAATAPEAQATPDPADAAEAVTAEETAPEAETPESEASEGDEKTQVLDEDEKTQLADDASESDNQ